MPHRPFEPTPIPESLERDALFGAVIDSAPIGGILTDGSLRMLHANTRSLELLGLEGGRGDLVESIASSRIARPASLVTFLRNALQGGELETHYIVESVDGHTRRLRIEGRRCNQLHARWVWWIRDVTEAAQVQQLRLLAEIGRARGKSTSPLELAERLVDAILQLLGADIAVLTTKEEHGLRPLAARGLMLDDGFILDPTHRLYVEKALSSGRTVMGDGSEWDAADQEMTGTHYIVPLAASSNIIGTLHFSFTDDYDDRSGAMGLEQDFLDALSAYAGSALASARLFEELRKERTKLHTLVDFIPQGILLFTQRGDVLVANAAARTMTGVNWVNVNTASRPYRLLDGEGQLLRRTNWPLFRIAKTGRPILGEVVIMDFGDHQIVASVSAIPVPSLTDDSIPTYLATLLDITAERAQQREREGFLQIASHELRSPLTPLTGFLQMLRKQAEAGNEVDAELLYRSERQVARLARLVDSLLDMTRLERGVELNLQTADLGALVEEIVDVWRPEARGVSLIYDAPAQPIHSDIDALRLEQIVTNLLENAAKHGRGGTLELTLRADRSHGIIAVQDHGRGIAASDLPHIFDRFFSGAESRGGIGLGLFITRGLVLAHGGEIRVESTVGEGTKFEVLLPLAVH